MGGLLGGVGVCEWCVGPRRRGRRRPYQHWCGGDFLSGRVDCWLCARPFPTYTDIYIYIYIYNVYYINAPRHAGHDLGRGHLRHQGLQPGKFLGGQPPAVRVEPVGGHQHDGDLLLVGIGGLLGFYLFI